MFGIQSPGYAIGFKPATPRLLGVQPMLPSPVEPNELLAMMGAVALSVKPAPVQTAGEFFGLSAPPWPAGQSGGNVAAWTNPTRAGTGQDELHSASGDSATFTGFALATLATLATTRRPGYQPIPRNRYAVDRLIECAGKQMVAL